MQTTEPERPTLQRLRMSRGPLKAAAKATRATKSTIHRWDMMEREPVAKFRKAYADFLGITVGQLGAIIYERSVSTEATKGRRDRA